MEALAFCRQNYKLGVCGDIHERKEKTQFVMRFPSPINVWCTREGNAIA